MILHPNSTYVLACFLSSWNFMNAKQKKTTWNPKIAPVHVLGPARCFGLLNETSTQTKTAQARLRREKYFSHMNVFTSFEYWKWKVFKAVTIILCLVFRGYWNFPADQKLRNSIFIVFRTQLEKTLRETQVYWTGKKTLWLKLHAMNIAPPEYLTWAKLLNNTARYCFTLWELHI